MLPSGKLSASEIDVASEPLGIVEVFADKFNTLYKSVPTDEEELGGINKKTTYLKIFYMKSL